MGFGQEGLDPGHYTLIFSGSTLVTSHFVQSMKTNWRRLTGIQRRQNLWATSAILDGRYPAQVWEHDFLVYTEVNSFPYQFAKRFFDLETKVTSDPQLLVLQANAVNRISFGNVYLETALLSQPNELLLYRAGFMRVRFVGNTLPTTL